MLKQQSMVLTFGVSIPIKENPSKCPLDLKTAHPSFLIAQNKQKNFDMLIVQSFLLTILSYILFSVQLRYNQFRQMQQSILACKLCYDKFNVNHKKPVIVCQQNHSICMECLQNLTLPFACPFCREKITKQSVKVDSNIFRQIGGSQNTTFTFRYLYYRDQLRIIPENDPNFLNNCSAQSQKVQNQHAIQTAKSILKVLSLVFIILTVINLIVHLCLVFTQQQQCIDWNEHPHTYTIREYLKLNILINIGCFSIAAALYISENANIKGFIELYGQKMVGIYIVCRLLLQIWMWSHFMFVMQPQCSTFTFLYLHIETFGYYLFAFLFTVTLANYCVRKQRLAASE